MGVEVEKKYKLTRAQKEALLARLRADADAVCEGDDEEENTLFAGAQLDVRSRVLRLRRTQSKAVFTYKERQAEFASTIRRQREDETEVADADALTAILDALGYRPALVYEKRRTTWRVAGVELVIDELPFGLYAEIEGEEDAIENAEKILELSDAEAEMATYPDLAAKHGVMRGDVVEARFAS